MNYPQTVDELIHWDTFREHDRYGWFTVITGYEGTGRCFWCGDEIEGRRRFCRGRKGCWTRYQEHFRWGYASVECLKLSGYTCANCGLELYPAYWKGTRRLEIHHIIPLNGEDRTVSVYNIFWNLICLCHDCHMELHSIMRPPRLDNNRKPDTWNEAVKVGQAIFNLGAMK